MTKLDHKILWSCFQLLCFVYSLNALTTCNSTRVRQNASNLQTIAHCDVIAGSLVIDIMEENSEDDWHVYGNLKLQEITDYLFLYSIMNLRSLDILFPNLRVIRGNQLLHHQYAFGIYQMDLQDLSLPNLTAILNGGVFVSDVKQLSGYAYLVNWDAITLSPRAINYIEKPSDSTARCNSSCANGNCWSKTHCQKVCPEECGGSGCMSSGECCHSLCVGGCSEPNNFQKCYSCKNFRFESGCRENCNGNLVEWDNFKCVTLTSCTNEGRFLYYEENKCVKKCPGNYIADKEQVCRENSNDRSCDGGFIGSTEDSQKFTGCNVINGSLMIRLSNYSDMATLETNLGRIERITEFLRVFETGTASLSFLRNLTDIEGHVLSDNKYSLVIEDCQNLQSLWTPERKLTLHKGDAMLFLNPKLCPSSIRKLVDVNSLDPLLRRENTQDIFNGYRTSCSFKELDIRTKAPYKAGVIHLHFHKPHDATLNKFLSGFRVYYIKAPNNTTFRGKEDVDSRWSLRFFEYNDSPGSEFQMEIQNLQPSSRYAFFIISSVDSTSVTYQSRHIVYETTKPVNPGRPENFNQRYGFKKITITWSPPKYLYAPIDFYTLQVIPKEIRKISHCTDHNLVDAAVDNSQTSLSIPFHQKSYNEKPVLTKPEIEYVRMTISKLILNSNPNPKERPNRHTSDTYFPVTRYIFPAPVTLVSADEEPTENLSVSLNATGSNQTDIPNPNGIHRLAPHKVFVPLYSIELENIDPSHSALYELKVRACYSESADCPKDIKSPCKICSENSLKTDLCLVPSDFDARPQNVKVKKLNLTSTKVTWDAPAIDENLIHSYFIYFELEISMKTYTLKQKFCVGSTINSKVSHEFTFPANYRVNVQTILNCPNSSTFYTKTEWHEFEITTMQPWASILLHISWSSTFFIMIFIIYRASKRWTNEKFEKMESALKQTTPQDKLNCAKREEYFNEMIPREWNHEAKNLLRSPLPVGHGNFALVYKANLKTKSGEITVAAKVLREANTFDNGLIDEAALMLRASSHHIVRCFGMTLYNLQPYLIMEYMTNGTLESFLRLKYTQEFRNQNDGPEHLLKFALQVSDGMYFLENAKIIHRDLAARNCLLTESYDIKISDFGLSRYAADGVYQMSGRHPTELARMPPEYFSHLQFTAKCDVWLFGILIWELITECGSQLYDGLTGDRLRDEILWGDSLANSLPSCTPFYFRCIAQDCWKKCPNDRPDFLKIVTQLDFYARGKSANCSFLNTFREKSYYHRQQIIIDRNEKFHAIHSEDDEPTATTPLTET